jgi:hypothetical protein
MNGPIRERTYGMPFKGDKLVSQKSSPEIIHGLETMTIISYFDWTQCLWQPTVTLETETSVSAACYPWRKCFFRWMLECALRGMSNSGIDENEHIRSRSIR